MPRWWRPLTRVGVVLDGAHPVAPPTWARQALSHQVGWCYRGYRVGRLGPLLSFIFPSPLDARLGKLGADAASASPPAHAGAYTTCRRFPRLRSVEWLDWVSRHPPARVSVRGMWPHRVPTSSHRRHRSSATPPPLSGAACSGDHLTGPGMTFPLDFFDVVAH